MIPQPTSLSASNSLSLDVGNAGFQCWPKARISLWYHCRSAIWPVPRVPLNRKKNLRMDGGILPPANPPQSRNDARPVLPIGISWPSRNSRVVVQQRLALMVPRDTDLLAKIDLSKDVIRGGFQRTSDGIVKTDDGEDTARLSYEFPTQYDLSVTTCTKKCSAVHRPYIFAFHLADNSANSVSK